MPGPSEGEAEAASPARRPLIFGGWAALASLFAGGAAAARGAAAEPDIAELLAPEYRAALPLLKGLPTAPWSTANLAERRKRGAMFPPLASPAPVARTLPGPAGAPPVLVLIVSAAEGAAPAPVILHIHGGGFIAGDPVEELRRSQELATALGCVVVSVRYRLAPETPYPGPLEDCYAALRWIHAHAGEIGVDRSRIALYGGSAGGGLAAQLAVLARDRGEVPLLFQALFYPMLDDRTASTRRTPPQEGLVVWRPADNVFGWTSYLGHAPATSRTPAGAAPARLETLKGLPPAWIAVGDLDLFVDEDIQYARRLVEQGVPTELHVVPGAFHGFDVLPTATPKLILGTLVAALRNAFTVKA